ncbi:hypothetical protein NDI37_09035 [Funiculus sociatus GB2-A5]|uniref:Protein kinase domain-containing protein n=1 Tax=Funiculus sociatus GB2-A5 TaxID=2933946 RepID=A0ABV0JMF7_9CYAN|nr:MULTISPECIES: hypothetical protein [unclassified Trichocoleus]MBD1906553.1 hypothetical protein [Trichocoleus sp. FACHB-832]MBD2063057.1 hypothetical protein [Trichocoleus sp. FACHB-6]
MAWEAGQRLYGDRYIIDRAISRGGLGITYLAKDRKGNRVFIKTLKDEVLNNPELAAFRDKFQQDFLVGGATPSIMSPSSHLAIASAGA